jgi:hypothetical protein
MAFGAAREQRLARGGGIRLGRRDEREEQRGAGQASPTVPDRRRSVQGGRAPGARETLAARPTRPRDS